MGTIVKDGTIVYTHIDDIPRGAMEIRIPVPEGYVAEIISDGLIAIRPVESEDEKIRKEIVSFIRAFWVDHRYSVPQASKWLAYLEKQKGSPMPEDTVVFQKGVEEGRRLEREEQKSISSCDIVPYIDDKIAALQDMWREEKVAFDWDDMHEMIEDVARHFYQKEQKPAEWSEEDKRKLNRIYAIIGQAADTHAFSTTCRLIGDKEAVQLQDFLRSIAKPQIPEWSDEDELMRTAVIQTLETLGGRGTTGMQIDWLKSLRPQSHKWFIKKGHWYMCIVDKPEYGWTKGKVYQSPKDNRIETDYKGDLSNWPDIEPWFRPATFDEIPDNQPSWKPSEEELEALNYAIAEWDGGKRLEGLYALRNDLKKLI